jgi:hypothetical protein
MALGRKGETRQVRTVTLKGSSVAVSPAGVVGIVLDTLESGAIGFSVTLEICAGLRRDLAAAETFLRQKPGVG